MTALFPATMVAMMTSRAIFVMTIWATAVHRSGATASLQNRFLLKRKWANWPVTVQLSGIVSPGGEPGEPGLKGGDAPPAEVGVRVIPPGLLAAVAPADGKVVIADAGFPSRVIAFTLGPNFGNILLVFGCIGTDLCK